MNMEAIPDGHGTEKKRFINSHFMVLYTFRYKKIQRDDIYKFTKNRG